MSHPVRLSDAVNMALHTMVYLAGKSGDNTSTREIAGVIQVSRKPSGQGATEASQGWAGELPARTIRRIHPVPCRRRHQSPGDLRGHRGPPRGKKMFCFEHPSATATCILGGLLAEVGEKTRKYLTENTLANFVGTIPSKHGFPNP